MTIKQYRCIEMWKDEQGQAWKRIQNNDDVVVEVRINSDNYRIYSYMLKVMMHELEDSKVSDSKVSAG